MEVNTMWELRCLDPKCSQISFHQRTNFSFNDNPKNFKAEIRARFSSSTKFLFNYSFVIVRKFGDARVLGFVSNDLKENGTEQNFL